LITTKKPSFTLWKYSARYSLIEVEKYCRSDPTVFSILIYVLGPSKMGLPALFDYGIPMEMANLLVMDMVAKVQQEKSKCQDKLHPRGQSFEYSWDGGLCPKCLHRLSSLGEDRSADMKWPYIG